MKVWHKVLVAPAVAIAFLMLLGALSYVAMMRQNSALEDLAKNRLVGYELASEAAQEISEVHSNVYRLLTWLGNLSEEKIKKTTADEKGRIDAVIKTVTKKMEPKSMYCEKSADLVVCGGIYKPA